jgi:hypothetical protein
VRGGGLFGSFELLESAVCRTVFAVCSSLASYGKLDYSLCGRAGGASGKKLAIRFAANGSA